LLVESIKHFVALQHLIDRGVGFTTLLNRVHEFAVLQFNAVHRDVDLGDVDGRVVSVDQIVVAREVVPLSQM